MKSLYNKPSYEQYLAIKTGDGLLWAATEEGAKDLLPGDVIFKAKHNVSDPKAVSGTSHVMVYIGDGKFAHAASAKTGIYIDDLSKRIDSTHVFGRPKDLMEADEKAKEALNTGVEFKGDNAEFIKLIKDGAIEGKRTYGVFASVCMAQAILESGWGKSGLATKGKNLFGIKANKGWTGPVVEMTTTEDGPSGKYRTKAKFRAYNSFAESMKDHGRFLKENSRYTNHGVFSARTPREQISAIKAAGYATDSKYVSLVMGVIDSNNLTQFDK
jgi:flagellum-specific peptidoglycan hydrolase FlgJ